MLFFFKKYSPLLVILGLSLSPLLWFESNLIITGTDIDFSIRPLSRLLHRFQTWDTHFLGGTDRSVNVASLPFIFINTLIELFINDPAVNQMVGYCFFLFCIGCSMHFIMSQLLYEEKDIEIKNIKIIFACIFYMIGMYNLFLWVRLQLSISTLILFPIIFGLFIANCNNRISLRMTTVILVPISIFCGSTGIQSPLIYILFLFSFIFIFVYSFFYTKEITKIVYKYIYIIIIYLLSSSFWLLPLISFIGNSGYGDASVGISTYNVHSLLIWVGNNTSILNVLKGYGDIVWFDGYNGYPYWPEFNKYKNSLILNIFAILIPVIAFSGLFFKKYFNNKEYIFYLIFILLSIIAVLFSKGIHKPFGIFYNVLVDHFPYFWIQRAPWQKFGLMFSMCLSITFGISVGSIYLWIKIYFKKS